MLCACGDGAPRRDRLPVFFKHAEIPPNEPGQFRSVAIRSFIVKGRCRSRQQLGLTDVFPCDAVAVPTNELALCSTVAFTDGMQSVQLSGIIRDANRVRIARNPYILVGPQDPIKMEILMKGAKSTCLVNVPYRMGYSFWSAGAV